MGKRTLPKPQRLMKGKQWALQYDGQHIVKAYRKRFGVDRMTAIRDLSELGVLSEAERQILQEQERARLELLARQKEEKRAEEWRKLHEHQDDRFFYIAGYTSGGAPYGVTWEEMGLEPWEEPE